MQLPPPQIMTVFLVALDIDTENRIKRQLLPSSQYRCIGIPHFDFAIDILENADLVLSNILSKADEEGYNFIATIQRLRKNFPHVVIFEAEVLGDPEIIRAKQLGACYILWKPVSEQSDGIKNLRQHVFRGRAQNEDSSEDSSSSRVSSQQKSLKRENDQQPSEKEPESSKRPRIVWHKALLDLLVNAGDETKEKEKKKKLHQTPTTDSPPQAHVVCQQQIHHEQHLPCQPMHNSGVASLIGNGVNNLPSMPQPDGITSDILQQLGMQQLGQNLTSTT